MELDLKYVERHASHVVQLWGGKTSIWIRAFVEDKKIVFRTGDG